MQSKVHQSLILTTLFVAMSLTFGNSCKAAPAQLEGSVKLDGSSTVFPISEAVAEEFQGENRKVRVTVGVSGTGGGFKKFCVSETDINDASRPIKESEAKLAEENNIEYVELPVAFDGIAVMVNPKNDFVDHLTVEELTKIWSSGSNVRKWNEVRTEWPDREIHLYGPGTDSGTFDYFLEAIIGKDNHVRPDFTASEDDNILVQGISGDDDALGFFGFAYYAENKERLKLVGIDNGSGPIEPSEKTINDGSYAPLSRPIFIYVSTESAKKPAVESFVNYYLDIAPEIVSEVGYVALPDDVYAAAKKRFADRKTGSAFGGEHGDGATLLTILTDK